METKTKKNPCFAQTRYLLTKLCNIIDEAFPFDVSTDIIILWKGPVKKFSRARGRRHQSWTFFIYSIQFWQGCVGYFVSQKGWTIALTRIQACEQDVSIVIKSTHLFSV